MTRNHTDPGGMRAALLAAQFLEDTVVIVHSNWLVGACSRIYLHQIQPCFTSRNFTAKPVDTVLYDERYTVDTVRPPIYTYT